MTSGAPPTRAGRRCVRSERRPAGSLGWGPMDTAEASESARSNGLAPQAPNPDQTILVAGGAGYIGCVLIPRLLDPGSIGWVRTPRLPARGYRVRLLDRLYFGEEPIASFRNDVELVVADVRD